MPSHQEKLAEIDLKLALPLSCTRFQLKLYFVKFLQKFLAPFFFQLFTHSLHLLVSPEYFNCLTLSLITFSFSFDLGKMYTKDKCLCILCHKNDWLSRESPKLILSLDCEGDITLSFILHFQQPKYRSSDFTVVNSCYILVTTSEHSLSLPYLVLSFASFCFYYLFFL